MSIRSLAAVIGFVLSACSTGAVDGFANPEGLAGEQQSLEAGEVSLFLDSSLPTIPMDSDTGAVELGMKFRVSVAGTVRGVRFYKGGAQNAGPHRVSLWSRGGAKLAEATSTSETATGWQTVRFAAPINVSAGTTYVVSYYASAGRYGATVGGFNTEKSRGPIRGLASGADGVNGVYRYGGGFPTQGYQNTDYAVDVVFLPSGTEPPPVDPQAPGVPPGLVASAASASAIHLNWGAATDNVGVTAYDVFRDGVKVASTASRTYADTGLVAATAYGYFVKARDAAGNVSAASSTVTATTHANPPSGGFPNASNTGVPAGTQLTPYTGPCTLTVANTVIDSKTVNCDLTIRAAGVVIRNSKINGSVATDENSTGFSFTLTDSHVDAGDRIVTGVGAVNFTAVRVHVEGGNRSMHCWHDCEIRDSYVHGQMTDETGTAHESGIRMGRNVTLRHNTIVCDAPDVPPDAGCSAALTGYGDFAPVENNLVENNYFPGTTGGFCAYGGSSQGKPYSGATNNIRFIGNVFGRGASGRCGYYGAITSFDTSEPGNVWSNNTWEDGTVLPPSN
ncbi:DUF4082 domain-containing protein [Corallococcus sp. BB11-1]|uniref:DUF4082 domain-containing protein n=1 Tax=Corallococcus sp. BB11-1 TaxID=2996783 RepID=UPI0022704909|nr:DUF4082 domain-containing protein [Corallococcus sp. BB11-1]MCY1032497.1 DUF4082 domain-containing protein [Corallococcus sp. BB11-1]